MPKVIVMTGIGGGGKTTQADKLLNYLIQHGLKVKKVHQFKPVIPVVHWCKCSLISVIHNIESLLIFSGMSESFTCNKKNRQNKHSNKNRKKILAWGLAVYIIGTGFIRSWLKYLTNISADVIIFDRFFSDEIIRAIWKTGYGRKAFQLMTYLPSPHIIFFFSMDSESAWMRQKNSGKTWKVFQDKYLLTEELKEKFLQYRKTCLIKEYNTKHLNIEEIHQLIKKDLQSLLL